MTATSKKRPRPEHLTNGTHTPPPTAKTKTADVSRSDHDTVELNTVGDLIHARASEPEVKDQSILFYPSSGTNYVGYTPIDLEVLSNKAAEYYSKIVAQRTSSDEPPQTVAMLGPSNFDYLIGFLALSKLGHTVLFLSTRISEEAHVSLLNVSKAICLFVDDAFKAMGEKVQRHFPALRLDRVASLQDYDCCEGLLPANRQLDGTREANNVALIIHSSGSTSMPKPTYQTHAAALGNFKSQFSLVGFVTLPLFHMQGLGCVFRTIMNRKRVYVYNAALPLTSQHLVTTLREHPDIQILYGVPYAMKLLADSEEGIELCKRLEVVQSGGSAIPKPIGDRLAKAGINLVSHFGSSETGQLMNSHRPRSEIEEWDWLRPSAASQPYMRWEPYNSEADIFELVILKGWPTKSATNREDSAYATSDLWERHPDYPSKNAWRYYARKDDTIVLVNGEKANPLLFEGLARESSLVDEAIVFGSQKPHLGLFVVASNISTTQEQITDSIWPSIQKGNKVVPAHAQMSKDMIRLLSPEDALRIRKTDKASLIRAAFYKEFAPMIDAMYEESATTGSQVLDEGGLQDFLKTEIEAMIEPDRWRMVDGETDLFSLGIDSLQASRIRSAVLKSIDTGQEKLGENFVFDHPSINAMARELLRMRKGGLELGKVALEVRMQALIDRYSIDFQQHTPHTQSSSGQHVVVTGVTGSLGAHLAAQLVARADVSAVYCLVRAHSNNGALQRVQESMRQRQIDLDLGKIRAYASDFAMPRLGLSETEYRDMAENLTSVFHSAWNVNFNLGLESFEQDCLKGNRHLIDLCLKSGNSKPADLVFCSSVSTVGNSPTTEVPEDLPGHLSFAQDMGYAQSKLVAEHICLNAAKSTGLTVKVLRIGQIVGDTKAGIWNPQEAVPMIFRSASTIGALPKLDERHSWLPVDTVAAGVIEIWQQDQGDKASENSFGIFHVVNDKTFHWTRDLLPLLKQSGLHFAKVSPQDWLSRIQSHPDPVTNPPYKLAKFFAAKYGSNKHLEYRRYVSDKATAASPELAKAPELTQGTVDRFLQHLKLI